MYFTADDGVRGRELWQVDTRLDDLVGDTNGDNEVNFADFLALSANFGMPTENGVAGGDIDENGIVDFTDFLGDPTDITRIQQLDGVAYGVGHVTVDLLAAVPVRRQPHPPGCPADAADRMGRESAPGGRGKEECCLWRDRLYAGRELCCGVFYELGRCGNRPQRRG